MQEVRGGVDRLVHHLDLQVAPQDLFRHKIRSCNSARRLPRQRWMPNPNDMCSRGRLRSTMNSSARSICSSSRLPEMRPDHHLVAGLDLPTPRSSASSSAVRRRRITGVCQRTISETALVTSSGLARSFLNCSGKRLKPQQPAGHRVARGVVAAVDQEEDQDAHALTQRHFALSTRRAP